ncbi:hypothetical protein [Gordonia rhizosphera]|uniref:Uncharacterized protein n=1 Tax=Gordonia rhizosphera NBRC 16068 TaxID=1108045 RepID=K6V190_9ACTN|nr:hypothetical protein [Gordonia rhizosphera]GAB89678.1 hypothetical protein GORHZ_069_00570 [Gordonia rhizosphera NBRC 16068]
MTTEAPQLRVGEQLACPTCSTKVVVVKAPAGGEASVTCDGSPLQPARSVTQPAPDGAEPKTLIGKRYVDADDSVELLCTASGSGQLSCGGSAMTIKAAKALPASD